MNDHPALAAAAAAAERVVPLFVVDDAIVGRPDASPNRLAFLDGALTDLDASLRRLGAGLVVRHGDVVAQTVRVARAAGAGAVFLSEDVSSYAQRRARRLERACAAERIGVERLAGVTVVPAGELRPSGGDHFRVFTPYWRRWAAAPRRPLARPPRRLALPTATRVGPRPSLAGLVPGRPSPDLPPGGETAGRRRLAAFGRSAPARDGERHDDLAADGTSRLSPYLHLGCLSPLEVAASLGERQGGEALVRQLCWRDFFHQLLAAEPRTSHEDMRDRGRRPRTDDEALAAWREGRTGVPVVDAGMCQLMREGWMPNRARLIVAAHLTRELGIDWRQGARRFMELLVDGDVASNSGNWQWVAGTGADTRPNRRFNLERQARRFDPDGAYVRRHLAER